MSDPGRKTRMRRLEGGPVDHLMFDAHAGCRVTESMLLLCGPTTIGNIGEFLSLQGQRALVEGGQRLGARFAKRVVLGAVLCLCTTTTFVPPLAFGQEGVGSGKDGPCFPEIMAPFPGLPSGC